MVALRDRALERFGHVDVWVNNAGRGITRHAEDLTDEDVDDMILVNVKSALYGIQAILPHFKARGRGHVINVSSMLGRVPFAPIRSAYAAAKAALNSLGASLRMDLATSYPDIAISTVMPEPVKTEFAANASPGGPAFTAPNAQTADQVASAIVDLIGHPRPEDSTMPGHPQLAARYYGDVAAMEVELRNFIPGARR